MNVVFSIRIASLVDKQKWNDFVLSHSNATPYHQYAWLEACEDAYGQKGYGLIAEDLQGQCVGVFPLVKFYVPFRKPALLSLPYCDLGYPIGVTLEICRALELEAKKLVSEQVFENLEIRKICEGKVENTGSKVVMRMELPSSSEQLLASFKSKLRSQIRKAQKNGLTAKITTANHDFDGFYSVYSTNMRDLGSPVHSKKWFKAVLRAYSDSAVMCIVKIQDISIGAGIVLMNGGFACIPWASTLRNYNKLAPNMLLYWTLLSYCVDIGVNEFDFGRSTFGEGTYKFKQQWGAEPFPISWTKTKVDSSAKKKSNIRAKLRLTLIKIWARFPMSITNFLGPCLRRFISL